MNTKPTIRYDRILCCFFIWCWICLISCNVMSAKNDQPATGRTLISPSNKAAGMEFQKLRTVKGHFSRGKWNDTVDKWMGRKHQLMLHLQQALSGKKVNKEEIARLMGPPDKTLYKNSRNDSRFFNTILAGELKNKEDEILVYFWRGGHDFLYFVLRNKQLIKSNWWYAFE